MRTRRFALALGGATLAGLVLSDPAGAQEITAEAVQVNLDNVFVLLAAVLVIFMQAGFALVEAGLTRAKSVANIMMKNMMDFCAGVLAFFCVGYAIAFGDGQRLHRLDTGCFLGDGAFGVRQPRPLPVFFLFQVAFAATAATIVSGAMAERTKFKSYLLYSIVISAIIYPVVVHWDWGGGWLSTARHAVPRLRRLDRRAHDRWRRRPHGRRRARPPHRQVRPGRQAPGDPRPQHPVRRARHLHPPGRLVRLQPRLRAGGRRRHRRHRRHHDTRGRRRRHHGDDRDLAQVGQARRGHDRQRPARRAGRHHRRYRRGQQHRRAHHRRHRRRARRLRRARSSIGSKIDDPVGAISVHGVCGAFGTLCVGLFATEDTDYWKQGLFYGGGTDQLVSQIIGVVVDRRVRRGDRLLLFLALKATIGLRVEDEEEIDRSRRRSSTAAPGTARTSSPSPGPANRPR